MKITIKITEEEAIDAWSKLNPWKGKEDCKIEIERNTGIAFTGTSYTNGNDCLLCGKQGQRNTIHQCVTPTIGGAVFC